MASAARRQDDSRSGSGGHSHQRYFHPRGRVPMLMFATGLLRLHDARDVGHLDGSLAQFVSIGRGDMYLERSHLAIQGSGCLANTIGVKPAAHGL